ncbi:hypothetical protein F5888DRAFT_1713947 [Russula emetica]|nr:hypothetical protein F5888DRAFT_1713947 [Russula emetica]
MGVTGLWDILRPSGKLRSLTHLAVVDGFEGNPANLRGLRIGIDASIWFFHAAYGREGENPELRTLFFRCARLMTVPFLPLFIFDGPKRPKVKRGKRISGEKHWLVDSIKGMIEAFGYEWRMAPGEAEAELAHLNSIGVIDVILSDDVDNFLFGAKMVVRNPSINLTGNSKHTTKNADGRVDGNHSTIYTSADILAHPSVQLTRGGLILIGLLSGGDYHQAGLPRCGPGIAHGLAKSGLGDELLEAAQSLTRAELSEFLTTWRETLRNELRTNSRGHLGSKKPSLAKTIPDSFPDIDVLLSYTNPIISATDAGARRTHTPPEWKREPNLAKLAHVCELHFEWGLKDIIIKRFRTVLWPSIVLRALRRSALEADTKAVARSTSSPVRERESPRDAPGTPSKVLARHFSSMALEGDSGLGDLIVKIHGSRTHAYTDGILEYRLEIAPAQLVHLACAGIQGLRKPADTTYDVLPSESEDSGEDDDEDDHAGTGRKKKRRGGGPPPEPESHLRVWMPACMVRYVLPELVDGYEAALEAKRAKKSKPKVPRGTAKASVAKGKRKPALASRKTVQAPSRPTDEEYFDLDVSSSGESDGRASPTPLGNHSRPLPTTSSRDTPLPQLHPKKPNDAIVGAVDDVFASYGTFSPTGVVPQHTHLTQESPQRVLDVISVDDDDSDAPGPSKTRTHHHLSSPSKVLQRLDQNLKILNVVGHGVNLPSKARPPPIPPPAPSSPPSLSPRLALRPFPIAFEEEEEEESSSDDGRDVPSELSTSNRQDQHIMQFPAAPATPPGASSPLRLPWPGRPLPAVARKEEEEEESSDDPDTVPAELPVFHLLSSPGSPRGQRQSRIVSGNLQSDPPLVVHRQDTTSNVLNHNQHSRQQQQQLQPSSSSPSSSPSKAGVRSSSAARENDDDLLPPDHWRGQRRRRVSKRSSSSIISISTDNDDSDNDNDDNSLQPTSTQAPLLIARSRSRSVVSQRLAMTTLGVSHRDYMYRRPKNIEHEVIDLT